jgi:MFS family permease
MPDDPFRTIKAVLRTAFAWGFVLGAISSVLITALAFIVPGPGVESLPERIGEALFAGVAMGVRFAMAGVFLGTLFALVLRLSFRGKRVAELHPGKFALIGGVASAVVMPLFYQFLNILSGDGPVAWNLLYDDIPFFAVAGAAGAALTVWIARRGSKLSAEDQLAALEEGDAFDASTGVRERDRVGRGR